MSSPKEVVSIVLCCSIAFFGLLSIVSKIKDNSDNNKSELVSLKASNIEKPIEESQKEPTVETKVISETYSIPFTTQTISDPQTEYGKTYVKQAGRNGTRTIKYEVIYTDDLESSRNRISEEITSNPTTQINAVGTKLVWHCSDATSYDKNPYNDNRCVRSDGYTVYVSDSKSTTLDPTYSPGKAGHWWYNSK